MKRIVFLASLSLAILGCDSNSTGSNTQNVNAASTEVLPRSSSEVESDIASKVKSKEKHTPPATAYLEAKEVYNPEALIPPQCYTKTEGNKNPCYVCHQSYKDQRPNQMSDGNLQGIYAFSEVGIKNNWSNLFVDRTEQVNKISDQFIDQYVQQDNYTALISDLEKDTEYTGPIPKIVGLENADLAFNKNGFAKDNSHWVAYNYKPFPSTFWPTNGSTGDAMIRLPKTFRENQGQYSETIYQLNLAIVEMTIKGLTQLNVPKFDERKLALDLNGDNKLTETDRISIQTHYLGDAKSVEVVPMLYPQGVEFLHTVRYIGENQNGELGLSKRMKEVRYMVKNKFRTKEALRHTYYVEAKEKYHENLPLVIDMGDKGVANGMGWTLAAFIENESGQLRKQHYEELMFCVGCHKSIGTTMDQTFSFARKLEGTQGWGYIDLKNQVDSPNAGQSQGEYLTYMERVGGGDEFRQNREMLDRWFDKEGNVNKEAVTNAKNLYDLIMPSTGRATQLNKAYYTIVKEQSYIYGRDATILPAVNVLREVDENHPPLKIEHRHNWDLRLESTPAVVQGELPKNIQASAK